VAVAQIKFTQGANVGGDGQSVIGFVANTLVSMTDVNGGASSWAWEIVNWPGPLSSPPALTGAATQTATCTPTLDGVYVVKLTRTDGVDGTTVDVQFFGVVDDEGHILPSAGMSGRMTNVGATPLLAQAAGWMGRADASTNVFLDAYLRFMKTALRTLLFYPMVAGTQSNGTNVWRRIGSFPLDASKFPSGMDIKFRAVLEVATGKTAEVRLYNTTDGGAVAGSTLSSTSLEPDVQEATITLPSASKLYEVQLRMTTMGSTGEFAVCTSANVYLV
jgi:hypothetical protein